LVLGGVVTTVDAVNGAGTLERESVSQKQVAVADRIVLTKLDLARAAEPTLLRWLASLNSGAPVLSANHGRVDSQRVFGTGFYDTTTKSVDVNGLLAEKAHRHSHSPHHLDIDACAIVRAQPIRAVALTLFLETLVEHCGADLLRLKGIVNIAESPG